MTENQRFEKVIIYLQEQGSIQYAKDIADILGVSKDRVKYLRKENGGTLSNDELTTLKNHFPSINWIWVKLGEGEMISPNSTVPVNENEIDLILADLSELSEPEQKKLLKLEVAKLRRKISDIAAINNSSVFEELKSMMGLNKKK